MGLIDTDILGDLRFKIQPGSRQEHDGTLRIHWGISSEHQLVLTVNEQGQ